MMRAYYNEHDPKAAAWLRELIKDGLIADGEVDERDIMDALPAELVGRRQCHFFAGIGGWSAALRLAGWPDGRSVWTGSCPCQPFSAAGKRSGLTDERHLWPAWFWLIQQCRPDVIFGEQVASPDGLAWLDIVSSDLEAAGYSIGTVDLCAAGVGAPHIRQRLFFVAESTERRRRRDARTRGSERNGCVDQLAESNIIVGRQGSENDGRSTERSRARSKPRSGGDCGDVGLEHASSQGPQERIGNGRVQREAMEPHQGQAAVCGSPAVSVANTGHRQRRRAEGEEPRAEDAAERDESSRDAERCGPTGSVGNAESEIGSVPVQQRRPRQESSEPGGPGPTNGYWAGADWILCRDPAGPVWRPVKPGTLPLAHGVSGRMGLLRGAGNAIVIQAAAEVIKAYMA